MAGVTGFGGVFLRAEDPVALYAWYRANLGIESNEAGFVFPLEASSTPAVVALFKKDSDYFPVAQAAMLNLRVDDLDAVLNRLEQAGAVVDAKRDSYDFGRFGWFTDPAGNRVELWEVRPDGKQS